MDSCYIDVVLTALFIHPSDWIYENIIDGSSGKACLKRVCGDVPLTTVRKVQKGVTEVARKLEEHYHHSRSSVDLSSLRSSALQCPLINKDERFDVGGMNDPVVFLEYIFTLFPCCKIKRKTNSRKTGGVQVTMTRRVAPLQYLETGPLKGIDGLSICDLLRKQSWTLMHPKYVVLDLTRIDGRGRYQPNLSVLPNVVIEFKRTSLNLFAVVVWVDYHYTVYAFCGDGWYFFDDMKRYVRYIGSYTSMLQATPSVEKCGKLYFYSRT
jgi:hypothetical protein